ncbi:MAG: uracil-DNA glycosylase [bacterium]
MLSSANGSAHSRVMFVGEAPGRLGAGISGVPFAGDVAGRRFELLLAEAGLHRRDVFVTNAVLCLPLDAEGRNRTPRTQEIRRCSAWLGSTIAAVQPELVVAMGRVALEGLRTLCAHPLQLADAGAPPIEWAGRLLSVVYHPAARAQVHRPWRSQAGDWRTLGEWLRESADGRA